MEPHDKPEVVQQRAGNWVKKEIAMDAIYDLIAGKDARVKLSWTEHRRINNIDVISRNTAVINIH